MQMDRMNVPKDLIAQYSDELDLGPVGLWHIVPRVMGSASGYVDTHALRIAIAALLEAGAVPVRHVAGSGYEWVQQKQYGQTCGEIVAAIMAEWEPVSNDPHSLIEHCPWFARPDPAFPKYLKKD
jgi:hypothetical protein